MTFRETRPTQTVRPQSSLETTHAVSRPDFSKFTSPPPSLSPCRRPTPPLRTRPNTLLVASASSRRPTSPKYGRTRKRRRNGVSGHRRQSGGACPKSEMSRAADRGGRIWVDDGFAVNVTRWHRFWENLEEKQLFLQMHFEGVGFRRSSAPNLILIHELLHRASCRHKTKVQQCPRGRRRAASIGGRESG